MEVLPVIIFVLFAIMSLVEKALKKPPQGPPPRRTGRPPLPQQRMPPRRVPVEPPPPVALPDTTASTGRADDMVSEDFWRELTGRARVETPAPVPDLPTWDEDGIARSEAGADEEGFVEEARSLEDYRREIVVHEQPRVVSLETMPLPPERRHASFHQRMERISAAETAAEVPAASHALGQRLRSRAGIREAFITSEVLGRPKGLERP